MCVRGFYMALCLVCGGFCMTTYGQKADEENAMPVKYEYTDYWDSIPPVVYTNVDDNPKYPGGLDALNIYMRKNFVYPIEAWTDTVYKAPPNIVYCVVRKDGVAVPVDNMMPNLHPLYKQELHRVFRGMRRWEPAMIAGQPVDVMFNLFMLFSGKDGIPAYMEDYVEKTVNFAEKLSDYPPEAIEAADADTVISRLTPVFSIWKGCYNPEVFVTLASVHASKGEYADAAEVLERGLEKYHDLGFNDRSESTEVMLRKSLRGGLFDLDYYDPRKELYAAILRGACLELDGRAAEADSAYTHALWLADVFIVENGLSPNELDDADWRGIADMMREQAAIVSHSRSSSIQLNPDERFDIEREQMLVPRVERINEKVDEGKISNARVVQIRNAIDGMLSEKQRKVYKRSQRKFEPVKALIIRLRDGSEAETTYLESFINDSGTDKKLRSILRKTLTASESLDKYTKENLLRSLAEYAPLNNPAISDGENREAAVESNSCRDALRNVYPLEWLWY